MPQPAKEAKVKYRRISLAKQMARCVGHGTPWLSSCCNSVMTSQKLSPGTDFCTCNACGQGWAVVYPKKKGNADATQEGLVQEDHRQ